ncbi:hypothetical protein Nepgr_020926 [Nepenthes gracilis]|uniref:Uncharacterized protein n=1 Tax=Nepenthes gracilis TaxID=150966 RepID=A0AAD3SW63_NEPGR|nr:hypothetical protein Nepgr_020926 [Nepenthes gracilis]
MQFWMVLCKKHLQFGQLHNGAFMKWDIEGSWTQLAIRDNLEALMIYSKRILILYGDGEQTWKQKHQPRETISAVHASLLKNLKSSNFHPKEKLWTRFPPEGIKMTPPHRLPRFWWTDYCPSVLRYLMELF